jgi:hypothetical protein
LKPANGPFLTLGQIRGEYARLVLEDATIDPNLEEYLVELEAQTLAQVRERERSAGLGEPAEDRAERLLRRRTVLLGYANGLIDAATDRDASRDPTRPYRSYSATTLRVAAVCRLADDQRLLVS